MNITDISVRCKELKTSDKVRIYVEFEGHGYGRKALLLSCNKRKQTVTIDNYGDGRSAIISANQVTNVYAEEP